MRFFQETQERVRNSYAKRAIGVRAAEALLYKDFFSAIPGFEMKLVSGVV